MKKLARVEMKKIMGGTAPEGGGPCSINTSCSLFVAGAGGNGQGVTLYGECGLLNGHCKCETSYGDYTPSNNGGTSACGT